MKIRKLELQGFKSFVDRTVLTFDHDVTAVVGPNGCGKSNTVDAIRWCMGEQSPGRLRGRSMEDVIFNGSDSRAAHSFAEVSLTFDNSDGLASPEYAACPEITVTRRLGRDGASDYSINRTPARLMDVTNLFLGTGAGTKAYSIVEQGRVGLIVTSKPEDRRALFEEAAGITRFKARKKLTEKKIEATRQNLLRVSDILAEIEKSLVVLKRQAQKAERYKTLRAEIRETELYLASHKFLEITVLGAATRQAWGVAQAVFEGVSTALLRVEAESEASRKALFEAETALENAQRDAYAADNEARRLEAEIQRTRDAIATAGSRATDAAREQADVIASEGALGAERDTLKNEVTAVVAEEAEAVDRLAVVEERMREMRDHLAALETGLRAHREAATDAERKLAAAEATRLGVARRFRESDERVAKIRADVRAIERRLAEIAQEGADTSDTVTRLRTERDALADRRAALEREQGPMRQERERLEQALAEARKDRERASARLHALREVARRHEGVGQGTRVLLDGRDPAMQGLVTDALAVKEEFSKAVSAVLSDRWQDVRVATAEDGLRLLAKLRGDRRGRAAVVPSSPQRRGSPQPTDPIKGVGVRGMLVDLVGGASEVPDELWDALVRVVVVDSLEVALGLWQSGGAHHYVTLSGELFDASGRIVGGVPEQAGAGLLATHAEIRSLEPRVDALDALVDSLSEASEQQKTRVRESTTALESARADLHAQELAVLTVERDAKAHEAELAQGRLRMDGLARELAECEARASEAERDDVTLDRTVKEAIASRERARDGAMAGEAGVQAWRQEVERENQRVTDAKIIAARARERATAARNAVQRLERSLDELKLRGVRLEAELRELARTQSEGGGRLVGLQTELVEAVRAAELRQGRVTVERGRYDNLKREVGELDGGLRAIRLRRDAVGRDLSSLELRAREEALAMEHLVATMAEKHGVALPKIIGDHHLKPVPVPADRERLEDLMRTVERMGEVNLMAIEEHAEQDRRARFHAEQKADIEKALEQLEGAIAAMNRESRRRFRETFDAVNAHFQTLFPRLFRGGHGMLKLTDGDDLLESGVEIIAQPPGKKLTNLEAMSGGEKTMTAVTLLFALFMHRPSPFCLLDEVEAALDESNVMRFADLVRDLTDRSQFILITHNKRTMAMADVLYGVTMQEPGVSKLVSVKVRSDVEPGSRTAVA